MSPGRVRLILPVIFPAARLRVRRAIRDRRTALRLFLPAAAAVAWKTRHTWLKHLRQGGQTVDFYLDHAMREDVATYVLRVKFRARTIWLLSLFSAWTLLFFSISTNQEYYTFPVWPPLVILISGVMAEIEERKSASNGAPVLSTAWLTGAQGGFAAIGVFSAAALAWGLWTSRNLPFVSDVGTLLARRGVGDYTLSMSHLFDLTGPSFAALRLPAVIAAIVLLIGPAGDGCCGSRRSIWHLRSAWR